MQTINGVYLNVLNKKKNYFKIISRIIGKEEK